MTDESSNQQVIQLSIASRPDIAHKDVPISPSSLHYHYQHQTIFSNQSEHDNGPSPYGFNTQTTKDAKTIQMSDFSLIIQQGLQNARRESQQQIVISEIITQYMQNHEVLIAQTQKMQHIVRERILEEQQKQLTEKVEKLLNELQKIREKIRMKNIYQNKKGRILSPGNFYLNSNKKKSQQAYFNRKKNHPLKPYPNPKIKTQNYIRANLTKRSTSSHKNERKSFDKFETIRTKETIHKQKQLLMNRILVIKQSIEMTLSANRYKEEKLKCENNILREQIIVTDHELYDYHRKSYKKNNQSGFGSKNLKQLARQKSLKLRKSSLMGKYPFKNNATSGHSLSKKKMRIRSSYEKNSDQISPNRQSPKCINVRDEYFDKEKVLKHNRNSETPLKKTQYY